MMVCFGQVVEHVLVAVSFIVAASSSYRPDKLHHVGASSHLVSLLCNIAAAQ